MIYLINKSIFNRVKNYIGVGSSLCKLYYSNNIDS